MEKNIGYMTGVQTTVTRPNNTTQYAINDAWSDSASAPTVPTLANVVRAPGKCGIITDLVVVSSNGPATNLQGEILLFESAPAGENDNETFSLDDADGLKYLGKMAFTLEAFGDCSGFHATNLALGFKCAAGSQDLRFLVRVKNAYTPAANEVLSVRVSVVQVN